MWRTATIAVGTARGRAAGKAKEVEKKDGGLLPLSSK